MENVNPSSRGNPIITECYLCGGVFHVNAYRRLTEEWLPFAAIPCRLETNPRSYKEALGSLVIASTLFKMLVEVTVEPLLAAPRSFQAGTAIRPSPRKVQIYIN